MDRALRRSMLLSHAAEGRKYLSIARGAANPPARVRERSDDETLRAIYSSSSADADGEGDAAAGDAEAAGAVVDVAVISSPRL